MRCILFGKKEKSKKEAELERQVGPTVAKAILDESKAKEEKAKDDEFHQFFKVDLRPKLVSIPPFEDKKKIDIRYPLIAPYAYVHIYWDNSGNELIYEVEEPKLGETEEKLLKLVKIALEEMINVNFVNTSIENRVIAYLEKNVQSILMELGTKVTKKTYLKLMYYIYRDYVGLNKIEPLLRDYFIEDIECNGIKTPIYIVHRKYENIKTNVILDTLDESTNFVEKLAQKCGRYVSFAKPLLDGTLPDGSRVNATYSDDITTRGPTFTIRKFTKNPWTPIHLINYGTATPLIFAYVWLAIEYKFNVIVVGETGSGKTTFLNSFMYFIPPESRVCSIEDTRELNLAHENWLPAVVRLGYGIPNILGETYGGVSLFDLLKETFRQNPDYVIVGEIRGKEASVLFQGMASGHPSFGTFHAASVETLVQRLQTPPINLSASLVKSMDIVCIATHVKGRDNNFRRITQINEIIDVKADSKVEYNTLVSWNPADDTFEFKEESEVIKKITHRSGVPAERLRKELAIRAEVLGRMLNRHIINYKEFTRMISLYYKNPSKVLEQLGIQEDKLQPLSFSPSASKSTVDTDLSHGMEERRDETYHDSIDIEKPSEKAPMRYVIEEETVSEKQEPVREEEQAHNHVAFSEPKEKRDPLKGFDDIMPQPIQERRHVEDIEKRGYPERHHQDMKDAMRRVPVSVRPVSNIEGDPVLNRLKKEEERLDEITRKIEELRERLRKL